MDSNKIIVFRSLVRAGHGGSRRRLSILSLLVVALSLLCMPAFIAAQAQSQAQVQNQTQAKPKPRARDLGVPFDGPRGR